MCTQCKVDIVLQLQIVRICQVINTKETLRLADTLFCEVRILLLLIYNVITSLLLILCHQDIHLGKLLAGTSGQLLHKNITCFIKLCGLSALSGNDQRRTSLIDQYGIDLIDNRIMKLSLYKILLINNHVITKIIKTKLIVRRICDIAVVCVTSLIIIHGV